MAGINTGKVIAGGLVAGVIMTASDMLSSFVLMKSDMEEMIARLHLDAAAMQSTTGMVAWVASDLVFGILLVLTYALMRPRLGAGPKTAAVAGFILYLAVTIVMFGLAGMGVFTTAAFVKSSVIYLVIIMVASLVGGMIYTEE